MIQEGWILIVVLILNSLYYVIPSMLVYYHRETDMIRKRGYGLLITQAASTLIMSSTVITMFNYFIDYMQPCIFIVTISQVFGMIPTYIFLTRALNLIYENCRTRIAINIDETVQIELTALERFSNAYFGFFRRLLGAKVNSRLSVQASTMTNSNDLVHKDVVVIKQGHFNGEISNRVLLVSLAPYTLFTILLLLFPYTIFRKDLLYIHGCRNFLIFTPAIVLLGSLFLLIPLMLHTIYWIKDGLGMRNEITFSCFISGAVFIPFVVGFVRTDTPEVIGVPLYAFIIYFNSQMVGMIYPLYKVYQHKYLKANLKKTMDDFEVVMSNPDLYKELRRLLVRELCIENALFLEELDRAKVKSVKKHQQNRSDGSLDRLVGVKRIVGALYSKYVEAGAPFELNIPHKMSRTIQTTIEENENPRLDVFDSLRDLVRSMIYENTFQRFIQEASKVSK